MFVKQITRDKRLPHKTIGCRLSVILLHCGRLLGVAITAVRLLLLRLLHGRLLHGRLLLRLHGGRLLRVAITITAIGLLLLLRLHGG